MSFLSIHINNVILHYRAHPNKVIWKLNMFQLKLNSFIKELLSKGYIVLYKYFLLFEM